MAHRSGSPSARGVAPASRRLFANTNPFSLQLAAPSPRFVACPKLRSRSQALSNRTIGPSAVGAAEISPARKRWVITKKASSAVGAALCSRRLILKLLPTLAAAIIPLAPPLAAQQFAVTLDPAQTTIEYTLDSTLHTVHGTFKLKSGEIHFDSSTGKASGSIVVDATSGDSGNKSRDKKMHQEILESQKYPEITFTPQKISGTLNPHAASQLELSGIFELHGQDHPLTATIAVAPPEGPTLHATVSFTIPYIKWGLKDPSTWLLKASDTVTLQIQATTKLTPDQAAH